MCPGSAVETVTSSHSYEAARDEARLIQDSLLPTGTLRGDSFEIAYRFSPLNEVGGDFADFFQLPNGQVGLYMGDVVGKGLSCRDVRLAGDGHDSRDQQDRRRPPPPCCNCSISDCGCARFRGVTVLRFTRCSILPPANYPFRMQVCRCLCSLRLRAASKWVRAASLPDCFLMPPTMCIPRGCRRAMPCSFATDGLHEIRNERNEDLSWGKLDEIWNAVQIQVRRRIPRLFI